MKTTPALLGAFAFVVVLTVMVCLDAAKGPKPETETSAPLAVAIGRAAPVAVPVAIAKDPVEAQLNEMGLTVVGGLPLSAGFRNSKEGGTK